MKRTVGMVVLATIAGALALGAQDSVACKGPNGPMRFLASGLSAWRTGPTGVARMNLVGGLHPSATEVRAYRERYPATYLADSTKATVHRNVGTAYVLVLHGTLVVGHGAEVDFAKAEAYGPRSFIMMAAGEPYYVWSRGAVEVQVEAIGPPHPGPIPREGASDWATIPTFPAASSRTAPAESPPAPANGLTEWQPIPPDGRMRLFVSTPASPTELSAARYYFLPSFMQDSAKLIYHFHYGTELITVLCGTLMYGEGSRVDYAKARAYGPGSFIENTAGNPHFEWFRGGSESQVDFIGSGAATPLDPVTGQPQ